MSLGEWWDVGGVMGSSGSASETDQSVPKSEIPPATNRQKFATKRREDWKDEKDYQD